MSPTCLVTGGAGYIGSHTLLALLQDKENDWSAVAVDNLSNAVKLADQTVPESIRRVEKLTGKSVKFYEAELSDAEALDKIFSENDIYCVIHFAALKAVGESVRKPLEYYQKNVGGMCSLLQVMKKHNVYKMIYSSSCTVYGAPTKLPIDEGHVTGANLTSPYGRSKHFCEEIARDLCASDLNDKKWTFISLRYFNPVGAHESGEIGEDPNGIPNNLMPYISQVAVGRLKELEVYGNDYPTPDGTGVRDYIHVMDLADGHIKAMKLFKQEDKKGFTAINLGTGTGYSVLQMVAAFEAASGKKIPYKMAARRDGDTAAMYADPRLAESLLGWRATRRLEDMCRDLWNWQSKNPKGYSS